MTLTDFKNNQQTDINSNELPNNEWQDIQKSTFTNWCNTVLASQQVTIDDLYTDLCDGTILIKLYETISGHKIERAFKNPKLITHKLENVSLVIKHMSEDGIRFVNLDSFDICNGNPKLILALIWRMILYYQIGYTLSSSNSRFENSAQQPQNAKKTSPEKNQPDRLVSPKAALLKLIKALVPTANAANLTTDWNDGKLLAALVDTLSPGSCTCYPTWNKKNSLLNATTALCLAEVHLGIPMLIEPHHMVAKTVDELSMITYLSSFTTNGGVVEKYFVKQLHTKFPALIPLVSNMTTDWNSGVALCELVKSCHEEALSQGFYSNLDKQKIYSPENIVKCVSNIAAAVSEASRLLGIEDNVHPEILASPNVSALTIMSYLSPFLSLTPKTSLERIFSADDIKLNIEAINEKHYINEPIKIVVSSENIDKVSLKDLCVNVSYDLFDQKEIKLPLNNLQKIGNQYQIIYVPKNDVIHRIDATYLNEQIQNSPMIFNVISHGYGPSDVTIKDFHKDNFTIGECLKFFVDSVRPIDVISCVLKEVETGAVISCQVTKMSEHSHKVVKNIDFIGSYQVIIKANHKEEVYRKSITCSNQLKDCIKILCPKILYVHRQEKITIRVDATAAGTGQLEVKLKPQGALKTPIDNSVMIRAIENNGNYEIKLSLFGENCSSYIMHLYWNQILVPEKHILINVFDTDCVKIFGTGFNNTVDINQIQSLNINVKDCGIISELTGSIRKCGPNNNSTPIDLRFSSVGHDIYEVSYQLTEVGTYHLKVFMNGHDVDLASKKIEALDLQELKIDKVPSNWNMGDKMDVQVSIPITAGRGDLFYAIEGPDGPLKVFFEPIYHDENQECYALSCIPNKIGDYKLILNFGGLEVSGFPKHFKVHQRNLIDVSNVKIEAGNLKAAIYEFDNKFMVIVPKKSGKAILHGYFTYIPPDLKKHAINFCLAEENSEYQKYLGTFRIKKKYDIEIRIFYGEDELPQTPLTIPMIELTSIETTSNVNSMDTVVMNQRYFFDVFVPSEKLKNCLHATITPPTGPVIFPTIQEYPENSDHAKNWLGRTGLIHQIQFVPSLEGKYIIHMSFLNYPLQGFPFTLISQKAIPNDVNNIIVEIPDEDDLKIGDLVSIKVDARNTSKNGKLTTEIFDPDNISIPVDVNQIYCKIDINHSDVSSNLYQINFNIDKQGTHEIYIYWNKIKLPKCPFLITARASIPQLVPKNGFNSDGFVGEQIHVVLDNIYDQMAHLSCVCYDLTEKQIKTTIEPESEKFGAYLLTTTPETNGMHRIEVKIRDEHVSGSPFYFNASYPVNPNNIVVYGPGILSGVLDDDKGLIFVQTDRAGSGLLQVAVQGPKNGFRLSVNNREDFDFDLEDENASIIIDYEPNISGLYVINILWSGQHVPNSPFRVYNCTDEKELLQLTKEGEISNISSQTATNNDYFIC